MDVLLNVVRHSRPIWLRSVQRLRAVVAHRMTSASIFRTISNSKQCSSFRWSFVRLSRVPGTLIMTVPLIEMIFPDQSETSEPQNVLTVKKAILAMRRDEWAAADRLLHEALQQSAEEPLVINHVLSLLADVAISRGRWQQAEQLLTDLARRHVTVGGGTSDDNAFVAISVKLAGVMAALGRRAEARTGLQYSLDTQRRRVQQKQEEKGGCDEDTEALLGLCLDKMARFLAAVDVNTTAPAAGNDRPAMLASPQDIQTACQLMNEALEVRVKLCGQADHESLRLLNDLATLQQMCGQLDAAETNLTRAISLAEEHLASSSLPSSLLARLTGRGEQQDEREQYRRVLAASLTNLGCLMMRRRLLSLAHQHCSRALQLSRQSVRCSSSTADQRQQDLTTGQMARLCLEQVDKTGNSVQTNKQQPQ